MFTAKFIPRVNSRLQIELKSLGIEQLLGGEVRSLSFYPSKTWHFSDRKVKSFVVEFENVLVYFTQK